MEVAVDANAEPQETAEPRESAEPPESAPANQAKKLCVWGLRVRVNDLESRPTLNGCCGCIIRFHDEKDRFVVELEQDTEGERVLIKEENLVTAAEPAAPDACAPEFLCCLINCATDEGEVGVMAALLAWLDSGGNVNARRAPKFEHTAKLTVRPTLLLLACLVARLPIVEMLLRRGADPSIDDGNRGHHPLAAAVGSVAVFVQGGPHASDPAEAAKIWKDGMTARRRCVNALLAAGSPIECDASREVCWCARRWAGSEDINLLAISREMRWRNEYRGAAALDPEHFAQRPAWSRRHIGWTRMDVLGVLNQVHPAARMSELAV